MAGVCHIVNNNRKGRLSKCSRSLPSCFRGAIKEWLESPDIIWPVGPLSYNWWRQAVVSVFKNNEDGNERGFGLGGKPLKGQIGDQ